jgi:hypothetical protein
MFIFIYLYKCTHIYKYIHIYMYVISIFIYRHPVATNKTDFEVKYCNARKTKFCPWDVSGIYICIYVVYIYMYVFM